MTKQYLVFLLFSLFLSCAPSKRASNSVTISEAVIREKVNIAVRPVMQEYNIPGMAIAITLDGEHYFFNYGVASKQTQKPITSGTIFEVGSITKTLTATLASYAQVTGHLSLADATSKYFPMLSGSSFDKIKVLNLGTHTTGGLPLQVPDDVEDTRQLMDYFKNWKPQYEPGTHRSYSNPGTGLFGMVAARSLGKSFEDAMEQDLLPSLGMKHSYINIPADQMKNYAYGYSKQDEPIRVNPGVLASEAYGIKSTTADMIRFVDANMELVKLDEKLQQAINNTHTGYFAVGGMTQDLMWEQYTYPASLDLLLAGNAPVIIYEHNPVNKLDPPVQSNDNILINKTGSTNGFGGYVAFVPAKKIGIVILANRNYPINSRVTIAYQILTELGKLRELKKQ